MSQKKVVVIGGGTGSFVLLSGLKKFPLDLTAVVPVTDDGGSTGRLRDEFGFLPVGDVRQCLAALAPENSRLKQLLLYRFDKGEGLAGHNLGNLILTAMEDVVGNEPEAVVEAAKIFRLRGKVIPVANKLVKLVARYSDGSEIESEHEIETHRLRNGEKIIKLFTRPKIRINPAAAAAIKAADWVVFSPGDLFNSIIANLVIGGAQAAIKATRAKLINVINLMTLNSQTAYFSARDHLQILESYCGRKMDRVVISSAKIPQPIQKAYQKQGEYPVVDDLGDAPGVTRRPLLAQKTWEKPSSDTLRRSLLRHDPDKLARTLWRQIG